MTLRSRWAHIGYAIFCCVIAVCAALPVKAETGQGPQNVVALGGSVTEIVYALGEGHRLVARDTTSTYPTEAAGLPDVGYVRRLSPEGVLSVGPELVLAQEGAGPPEAIDILKAAQVPFVEVPEVHSRAGVVAKIQAVGDALGVTEKARDLARDVDADLAVAEERARDGTEAPKRVLFVLSTEGGRIMASGTDTGADAIIRMSGAENAVTGFEGYKLMSDEAITVAAPDVILMMDRGGDHRVAEEDLFALPAISTTPAAAERALVRMNGLLLLGFGPRTADAVTALNRALYPD